MSQTRPTGFSSGNVRIGRKEELCSPVTHKTQNPGPKFLRVRVERGPGPAGAHHVQMGFSELPYLGGSEAITCLPTTWSAAPKGTREQDPAWSQAFFVAGGEGRKRSTQMFSFIGIIGANSLRIWAAVRSAALPR